jgi:hypothetical protein
MSMSLMNANGPTMPQQFPSSYYRCSDGGILEMEETQQQQPVTSTGAKHAIAMTSTSYNAQLSPERFVPQFPVLPKSTTPSITSNSRLSPKKLPGPLPAPSLVIAQYGANDMKQIAKEALRLSKETLLWHRNHSQQPALDGPATAAAAAPGMCAVYSVGLMCDGAYVCGL